MSAATESRRGRAPGAWAPSHVATLARGCRGPRHAGVRRRPARAKEVAASVGAEIADSAEALIADAGSTRWSSPRRTPHEELALACIAAGKPVLCEKPLAYADEARRVVDAEVALGRRLLQVGFMRRFDPGFLELKASVDDGALGDVRVAHGIHRNASNSTSTDDAGLVTGSMIHEFDTFRQRAPAERDPLRDRVGEARRRGGVSGAPHRAVPSRVGALASYDDSLRGSPIWKELYEVRNIRQAFDKGFFIGGALASMMTVTKGQHARRTMPTHPNAARAADQDGAGAALSHARTGSTCSTSCPPSLPSGNRTRDDQPNHLRVAPRVRARSPRRGRGCAPRTCTKWAPTSGTAWSPSCHPLQLRPVRGDLREGRAADPARRRLGPRTR